VNFSAENYAIPHCVNSHSIAESPSLGKLGDNVLLSSAGGQGNTGGEGPRPSIFSSNPPAPTLEPDRGAVPVYGQGDNPTSFTTAGHGERLTSDNTYNTSNGKVDLCDRSGDNHK
jgi:hypothetical protein